MHNQEELRYTQVFEGTSEFPFQVEVVKEVRNTNSRRKRAKGPQWTPS